MRIEKLAMALGGPLNEASWRTGLQIAGSIASLVAIILSATKLLALSDDIVAAVLVVVLLCLTPLTVWRMFQLQREYGRRSRFAYAAKPMHAVEHTIRDAEWQAITKRSTTNAVVPTIESALSQFAQAFTIITAAPVRACIKVVAAPEVSEEASGDEDDIMVRTLCRDTYSPAKKGEPDYFPVSDSTAFEHLLFAEVGHFNWWYSNDLTTVDPYKNPSIPPGHSASVLTYRSTCIWPIQKEKAIEDSQPDLLGFLCIDAPVADIFVKPVDFEVGAAVADSLYALLKLCQQNDRASNAQLAPALPPPDDRHSADSQSSPRAISPDQGTVPIRATPKGLGAATDPRPERRSE